MGLTTWDSAPYGKIVKSDVSIAKNYLNAKRCHILKGYTRGGYEEYVQNKHNY